MKQLLSAGIILLLIAVTFLIFGASGQESGADEGQADNLENAIASLENELAEAESIIEELRAENEQLAAEQGSDTPVTVIYKDFTDAVNTVESYKEAETLEETEQYFTENIGTAQFDRELETLIFHDDTLDWEPGDVLELREFSLEEDSFLLTYDTADEIRHRYGFVLVEEDDGWKIDNIKLR